MTFSSHIVYRISMYINMCGSSFPSLKYRVLNSFYAVIRRNNLYKTDHLPSSCWIVGDCIYFHLGSIRGKVISQPSQR